MSKRVDRRDFYLTGMSVNDKGQIATYRLTEIDGYYKRFVALGEFVVSEFDLGEMLKHERLYRIWGIKYYKKDRTYEIYNNDSLPVYDYKYKNIVRLGKKLILKVIGINNYIVLDEHGKIRNGDVNDLFLSSNNTFNIYDDDGYFDINAKHNNPTIALLQNDYESNIRKDNNRFEVANQIIEYNNNNEILGFDHRFEYDVYKAGERYVKVIKRFLSDSKQRTIHFNGEAVDLEIKNLYSELENGGVLDFSGMKDAVLFNIHIDSCSYSTDVSSEFTIALPKSLKCKANLYINCRSGYRDIRTKINIVNADNLVFSTFAVAADEVTFSNNNAQLFIDNNKKCTTQDFLCEIYETDFNSYINGKADIYIKGAKLNYLKVVARKDNCKMFISNCKIATLDCSVYSKVKKDIFNLGMLDCSVAEYKVPNETFAAEYALVVRDIKYDKRIYSGTIRKAVLTPSIIEI